MAQSIWMIWMCLDEWSEWGSGQQDASAAQGTKQMLGTATRTSLVNGISGDLLMAYKDNCITAASDKEDR